MENLTPYFKKTHTPALPHIPIFKSNLRMSKAPVIPLIELNLDGVMKSFWSTCPKPEYLKVATHTIFDYFRAYRRGEPRSPNIYHYYQLVAVYSTVTKNTEGKLSQHESMYQLNLKSFHSFYRLQFDQDEGTRIFYYDKCSEKILPPGVVWDTPFETEFGEEYEEDDILLSYLMLFNDMDIYHPDSFEARRRYPAAGFFC